MQQSQSLNLNSEHLCNIVDKRNVTNQLLLSAQPPCRRKGASSQGNSPDALPERDLFPMRWSILNKTKSLPQRICMTPLAVHWQGVRDIKVEVRRRDDPPSRFRYDR